MKSVRSSQDRSKRQERRVADNLAVVGDSRQTIASGRLWFSKADVRVRDLLRVECKTSGATDTKGRQSFSIKKAWLEKVEAEAFRAGRGEIPCLVFSYDEDKDYFVLEDYYLINIMAELVQLRERVRELEDHQH